MQKQSRIMSIANLMMRFIGRQRRKNRSVPRSQTPPEKRDQGDWDRLAKAQAKRERRALVRAYNQAKCEFHKTYQPKNG